MKDLLFNSGKVLGRTRFPWVDYARGISIILVCYRHVFEGLAYIGEGSYSYPWLKYTNIFFFSFRMPLFFIVSGMFFSAALARNGFREYINKRFQTIFYPLLIWGGIQVALQLIFADYVHADRKPIDFLNLIINPRRIEQFWYLNALFFVGLLYVVLRKYAKLKAGHQLLLGLIFYSAAGLFYFYKIEVGFLFDVLFFYFFFAIGDLVSDFILNSKNYKVLGSARTFYFLLPLFLIVQYYFTELNLQAKNDYFVQYQVPVLYAVAALIGGAFVINVSFILERLNTLKFLRVVGYHSLHIYVMHLMVTSFTRISFVRIFDYTWIPVLLPVSIVLGITVPIIVYNLANRLGAWWLFTLKKPNPSIESEKKSWSIKTEPVQIKGSSSGQNH